MARVYGLLTHMQSLVEACLAQRGIDKSHGIDVVHGHCKFDFNAFLGGRSLVNLKIYMLVFLVQAGYAAACYHQLDSSIVSCHSPRKLLKAFEHERVQTTKS